MVLMCWNVIWDDWLRSSTRRIYWTFPREVLEYSVSGHLRWPANLLGNGSSCREWIISLQMKVTQDDIPSTTGRHHTCWNQRWNCRTVGVGGLVYILQVRTWMFILVAVCSIFRCRACQILTKIFVKFSCSS